MWFEITYTLLLSLNAEWLQVMQSSYKHSWVQSSCHFWDAVSEINLNIITYSNENLAKLSSLIRHTIQSSNVWIYWSNEKSQMVLGKMGWPKLSWAMLDVPHWSNGTSQVVHGKFQIVLGKMGWPNGTSLRSYDVPNDLGQC